MISNHSRVGIQLLPFPGTAINITLLPTYTFSLINPCMPRPLQPTLLHFLGYFPHLRCSSNSVIPYSAQLCDSTHPSRRPHLRHMQLILLCFLHCLYINILCAFWQVYAFIPTAMHPIEITKGDEHDCQRGFSLNWKHWSLTFEDKVCEVRSDITPTAGVLSFHDRSVEC